MVTITKKNIWVVKTRTNQVIKKINKQNQRPGQLVRFPDYYKVRTPHPSQHSYTC